jgi:hypothetical protein
MKPGGAESLPGVGHMGRNRCMVCAKPGDFKGGICDPCNAKIRGEVLKQQEQVRKDADRSLHKEGTVGEKKPRG